MFTNKLSKQLLAIVIAALTLVTLSFVVAPKASQPYQDYALRHPGGVIIPVSGNLDPSGSDYYQRHRELTRSATLGIGASDYFQRHPELTSSVERSMDTTDYFFRHLELQGSSIKNGDMTDYFFRHIND